jgi:hypothetical protein
MTYEECVKARLNGTWLVYTGAYYFYGGAILVKAKKGYGLRGERVYVNTSYDLSSWIAARDLRAATSQDLMKYA